MGTSLSQPLSYLSLFGLLLAGALFYFGCRKRRWTRAGLMSLAGLIFLPSLFFMLALNAWITDARFRTYRNFYYDIEKGMSRAEVLEVMKANYPVGGLRKGPIVSQDEEESLWFFMNPEDSREPNCEGIFLSLWDGRVISKSYSPD